MAVDKLDGTATQDYQDRTNGDAMSLKMKTEIDQVLYSEIGLTTLLDRLKQSMASVRDFAAFLKKRASIEEDHAKDIKRLAKTTHDNTHRGDSRKGTYLQQLSKSMQTHDLMSDNGTRFAVALTGLHDDMNDLLNNIEKERKRLKHEGLEAEKKASDAEAAANRAKAKYDSLAEDYDRAKTGGIKGSRRIMKGPRSAAQHEEDLLRKLQAADADYAQKVQSSRAQTAELLNIIRPRTVHSLLEQIRECDAALTFHLQKYAMCYERLLFQDGTLVAPIPNKASSDASMGVLMRGINNEADLNEYILEQRSNLGPRPREMIYEQHPTLQSKQQQIPVRKASSSLAPQPYMSEPRPIGQSQRGYSPPNQPGYSQVSQRDPVAGPQKIPPSEPVPGEPHFPPDGAVAYPVEAINGNGNGNRDAYPLRGSQGLSSNAPNNYSLNGQAMRLSSQARDQTPSDQPAYAAAPVPMPLSSLSTRPAQAPAIHPLPQPPPVQQQQQLQPSQPGAAPAAPVFGIDLQQISEREGIAVPRIVTTCINTVELFGLTVDGIYRHSGTKTHVQQLKQMFDDDPSGRAVDFRNPTAFQNDIHSVADVLKSFLRELPDPLISRMFYAKFLEGARVEDDIARRDALHGAINDLPDPNYATLRALVLHLNKVQQHATENRMTVWALALCFAPSLLGSSQNKERAKSADPTLEARVVETIISNALDIFDEEDDAGEPVA